MDADLKLNKAVPTAIREERLAMFYCFCKLWNSETKEQWIFGRWYKDGHSDDIPKALLRKANQIKEYRKGEPEYNAFSLSYGCVKDNRATFEDDKSWYHLLYITYESRNLWKCIALI